MAQPPAHRVRRVAQTAANLGDPRPAPEHHHRGHAPWVLDTNPGAAVGSASSRNFLSITISGQGVFATQGIASLLGKKCASGFGTGGLPSRSVRNLKGGSLATSKGGKDHDADHRDRPVDSAFRWRGRLLLQKTGTLVGRCPAPAGTQHRIYGRQMTGPSRARSDERFRRSDDGLHVRRYGAKVRSPRTCS